MYLLQLFTVWFLAKTELEGGYFQFIRTKIIPVQRNWLQAQKAT